MYRTNVGNTGDLRVRTGAVDHLRLQDQQEGETFVLVHQIGSDEPKCVYKLVDKIWNSCCTNNFIRENAN